MDKWKDRKQPDTLLLFDVDGTLTPARRSVTPEMLELLRVVRKEVVIGFVGGSDLAKQQEQLGPTREQLESQSFIGWLGEEKYKKLVNFLLKYLADIDLPFKRVEERNKYEEYDKIHKIRPKLVEALKANFKDFSLTYSIGGQISIDVFPTGWDKTYCLKHVKNDGFKTIHFFGDKAYEGGNDWEIYNHELVIGHSVKNPDDTIKQVKELFPHLFKVGL
ncbi:13050_t:CDS:2 [Gigaspora margarita]|uniref:Phosphomannomutase n=1 Tax=Gigaspora margarita TaxID=4874 RepID=A0ABN7V0L3_GIGMA|nr:13050_t:CDS:2 [Gigaspora margarita]